MRAFVAIGMFVLIVAASPARVFGQAWTWRTMDYSGADWTRIYGIEGTKIVGQYEKDFSRHGFVCDGTTWTNIDYPGMYNGGTICRGISGNTIVGSYSDRRGTLCGFSYDGTTFKTLEYPGGTRENVASGISGNTIVGRYLGPHAPDFYYGYNHASVYDGSSWQSLDYPGAVATALSGISGNTMVGWYETQQPMLHGCVYDGTHWTTLNHPLYPNTWLFGISGSKIVGQYWNDYSQKWHGVLYNGATWADVDYPGAVETYPQGVWGNTIVGYYTDGRGLDHGLMVTVPEPASLALLAVGGLLLARKRRA